MNQNQNPQLSSSHQERNSSPPSPIIPTRWHRNDPKSKSSIRVSPVRQQERWGTLERRRQNGSMSTQKDAKSSPLGLTSPSTASVSSSTLLSIVIMKKPKILVLSTTKDHADGQKELSSLTTTPVPIGGIHKKQQQKLSKTLSANHRSTRRRRRTAATNNNSILKILSQSPPLVFIMMAVTHLCFTQQQHSNIIPFASAMPFNPFFMSWYRGDPLEDFSSLAGVGNFPHSSMHVPSSSSAAAAVAAADSSAANSSFVQPPPKSPPNSDTPFLTPHDFQTARISPVVVPSAEEMTAMLVPTLFEGDIMGIIPHPTSQLDSRRSPTLPFQQDATSDVFSHPYNSALNLGTYPDKLWPFGRVPYQLEKGLEEHQRVAIAQAFQEYRDKTCVEFTPRMDGDPDFVFIRRNKHLGCSSYVGRAGGNQTISLEVGKCFTKGIVAHELMHSLGFFHEHSRTDRDKFVKIDERNVKPGMLRNFEKYPRKIIDTLDMPYDYGSVMHYHKLAFSKNGRSTIAPKDPGAEIGQRYRLSEIDAAKVNKLYGCPSRETIGGMKEEEEQVERDRSSGGTTINSRRIILPSTTSKPGNRTNQITIKKPYINKVKPSCRDLNDHCRMWSEIGHCKWSEKYMSHYCRKSCSICTSSGGPNQEGSKKSKIFPKGFKLSRVTNGRKIGGSRGLTKNGKTSSSSKTNCSDQNLFCGYWARIGECKTQSKFMRIFCKRSCRICP